MGIGKKEPKSKLQGVFVKRLSKEMDDRGISDNALAATAKRNGFKLSQTYISAIKRFERDPTLGKVHAISESLGLPAWFFMTEESTVEQRVITPPKNVVSLPSPYRKIFGEKPESTLPKPKSAARKKRS